MKKYLSLLLLFVVGFCIIPVVHAEDEIPTEGVHYFLTYPNNEHVISEDYEDVTREILLYTGKTNANGEVTLSNWKEEGQIRIVQMVPSGYQTDYDTLSLDLSEGNAEFIDFRKDPTPGKNPHTGQSLLFLLLIGGVLGGTYLTVKSPKKKKLMMIPVVALAALSLHVFADSDFVIVVKDKQGNRLANVDVLVYGTPVIVDAAPAVVFSANGGVFLDGTDEMIMRLPSNNCSIDEFMSSLSGDDNDYFWGNFEGAVRDGYNPGDWVFPDDGILSDGMVIDLSWEEQGGGYVPKSVTLHGNGGYLPFVGSELTEVLVYDNNYNIASSFVNGNLYFLGVDDNPECSHFHDDSDIDIARASGDTPTDLYVCWTDDPSGGEIIK